MTSGYGSQAASSRLALRPCRTVRPSSQEPAINRSWRTSWWTVTVPPAQRRTTYPQVRALRCTVTSRVEEKTGPVSSWLEQLVSRLGGKKRTEEPGDARQLANTSVMIQEATVTNVLVSDLAR